MQPRAPYTLPIRYIAGRQVLQRIPILTYHSLNTRGKSYPENDHVALEQDLLTIKTCGFRVLPLTTLVDHYLAGTLGQVSKQRVCAITFDDGVLHDCEHMRRHHKHDQKWTIAPL